MVENTEVKEVTLVTDAQKHLKDIYDKQTAVINNAFTPEGKISDNCDPKVLLKALNDATKTIVAATNIKQVDDENKDVSQFRERALEIIRATHNASIRGELAGAGSVNTNRNLPEIPILGTVSDAEATAGIVKLDPDDYRN